MGALKYLSLSFGAAGLTGLGGAYSYRQTLVTQRRMELEGERSNLLVEQKGIEEELKVAQDLQKTKEAKINNKRRIVENLWNDRFYRYVSGGLQLQGYVTIMGEGIGMQKALAHHYNHMAKSLQPFPRFDFSVSHVHNLQILLQTAVSLGLHKAVQNMSTMLQSEPMVKAICESAARQHAVVTSAPGGSDDNAAAADNNVLNVDSEAVPRNLEELSRTFAFSVLELEQAVSDATEVRQTLGNQVPSFIAESSSQHSMILSGAQTALNSLRINPEKETPIVSEFKKRAKIGTIKDEMEAKKAEKANSRNTIGGVRVSNDTANAFDEEAVLLSSKTDIQAAMKHVNAVVASMNEEDNKWLLEYASSKKNLSEQKMKDASLHVVVALQQLQMWRKSAVLYLIEQQHLDALRAYDLCLAHTMCHIDHSVGRKKDE